MKKVRMILLSILILITGIPVTHPSEVDAASSTDAKRYKTGAWFEDGQLIFVSPNKKASSSITYGTKAFVIRLDETCTDKDDPVQDPLGAQCTPLSGTANDYLRIDLYDGPNDPNDLWTVQDIGECDYLSQYSVFSNDIGVPPRTLYAQGKCKQRWSDGYGSSVQDDTLVARFVTDKDKFTAELVDHSNPKFQNIQDGATVYLNSIFLIKYSGKPAFTPEYTTLSGIREAKQWANKSYFRNYYDVPVEYKGS